MDLSSDLPRSVRAMREFVTGGQSLSMNLLREADRGFRFDLKEGRSQAVGKVRLRTPAPTFIIGYENSRQGRMMAERKALRALPAPKAPLSPGHIGAIVCLNR